MEIPTPSRYVGGSLAGTVQGSPKRLQLRDGTHLVHLIRCFWGGPVDALTGKWDRSPSSDAALLGVRTRRRCRGESHARRG